MLVCARVARTRSYLPPSMVAAQIRAADPAVTSNGDRVPLPRRWLRGFAEVQVACAGMAPRAEWSATEARRFLQALPG